MHKVHAIASNIFKVSPFGAGSNCSEFWRQYKQDFEFYLVAMEYIKHGETKTEFFTHVYREEIKKQ